MQPKQDQKSSGLPKRLSKFILIGEDDRDDEDLLKEIFTSIDNSLTLVFVHNGRKLMTDLEQMKRSSLPSLIILDYNMPEMNGAEILARLKQNDRYATIPKVIWSTSNSDTYRRLCMESGANDYIIKPSNVKELTDVVRYMLSLSESG